MFKYKQIMYKIIYYNSAKNVNLIILVFYILTNFNPQYLYVHLYALRIHQNSIMVNNFFT
jgi:hypothetical protein